MDSNNPEKQYKSILYAYAQNPKKQISVWLLDIKVWRTW